MKIAISSQGKDLSSNIDERFGRAKIFIIYDLDNKNFKVIENTQNLNAQEGAGIQSAANVSREGVSAVITGNCGPKAFKTLQAAKVKVYLIANKTVEQAIEDYENKVLKEQTNANVEGHW